MRASPCSARSPSSTRSSIRKQQLQAPWMESDLEDPSFLQPDETVPPRTAKDFPEPPREDIREDVRDLRGARGDAWAWRRWCSI